MRISMLIAMALYAAASFGQSAVSAFGTVLDEKGNPVAGANVHMTIAGTDYDKNFKTNKKGKFTAFKIKKGEVTLKITAKGYVDKTYKYDHKKTREQVKVQILSEGASMDEVVSRPPITGVIVDSEGNPIPEVALTLTIDGVDGFKKELVTKADGTFETEGIGNNMIEIFAKKADYRDQIYRARLLDKPYKVDDFTMQTLKEAYAEMGMDPEKAKSAGKKDPKDQAIEMYNAAVPAYQQENWAMAEEMAKKAVALDPEMKNSLKMLVWCNHKQDDFTDVVEFGSRYLKLVPDDKNIYQVTVFAAEKVGDKDKLNELISAGEAAGAVDVNMVFNQAVEKLNAADDAGAAEILEKVISLDASYARAYFELGKIKTREFEFEDAIKMLNKYVELDPKGKYVKEAKDLIATLSE